MQVESIELVRFFLPLVTPFRTSIGTSVGRDVLLVHVVTDSSEGWGECVAGSAPLYSSEFIDGCEQVIRRFIAPLLLSGTAVTAARFQSATSHLRGHRMAKASVELALIDAELRECGVSLSRFLGGVSDRVEVGVSIGITDSISDLLDAVNAYLAKGYHRLKLKIQPGFDLEPVAAVRNLVGDGFRLQVDANTAYARSDIRHLLRLDEYDLLLAEQPFAPDELEAHAELARRSLTPVCLDESIRSAHDAYVAIRMGACSVVNIKAARVGGYLEARRVHDVCVAAGIPVWCGGELETGVGRAANVALASLPGFIFPGDISASDRYFHRDITEPFELVGSSLTVPSGPGLGISVSEEILESLGARRELCSL